MTEPYISAVIAARNDDHGGNMLRRIRAFVNSWLLQAEKLELPSEVIVVEWNPPAARPTLAEAIEWPARNKYSRIRVITVPTEKHARWPNAAAISLHQMIAKNAGIRRAAGQFVLATNLDIVFSAALMRFLADRSLDAGAMYRLDRHDVSSHVSADSYLDDLLAHCAANTLRVFTREGGFDLTSEGDRKLEANDVVPDDGSVLLGNGWYPTEACGDGRFRWMNSPGWLVLNRSVNAPPELAIELETGPSAGSIARLEVADENGRILVTADIRGRRKMSLRLPAALERARVQFRAAGEGIPLAGDLRFLNLRVFRLEWARKTKARNVDSWQIVDAGGRSETDWSGAPQSRHPLAAQMANPAYLHTNGCGDFTLMSRENWFALRGYPEFPIWPMHLDSLLCYSAHHAGIREVVLEDPLRIYHIEHSSGAGWTPEGEEERAARIEAKKVPVLGHIELIECVNKMRRLNAPMIFNLDHWGVRDTHLEERIL